MNGDTKVLNPVSSPVSASPVTPQGSLNKEQFPIGADLSEFVKPAGPETSPSPSAEEKESGVEVNRDKPTLTFEHQELGVDHAVPHVPVSSSPSGKITMPMSEKEIAQQFKTGRDDDSGKWLAGLLQKIMKALGL